MQLPISKSAKDNSNLSNQYRKKMFIKKATIFYNLPPPVYRSKTIFHHFRWWRTRANREKLVYHWRSVFHPMIATALAAFF